MTDPSSSCGAACSSSQAPIDDSSPLHLSSPLIPFALLRPHHDRYSVSPVFEKQPGKALLLSADFVLLAFFFSLLAFFFIHLILRLRAGLFAFIFISFIYKGLTQKCHRVHRDFFSSLNKPDSSQALNAEFHEPYLCGL